MNNNVHFFPNIPPAWIIFEKIKTAVHQTYHHKTQTFVSQENNTDVYYTFNSQGYREKEYAESYFEFDRLILAVGHSCVFGIDVRNEQCWPRLLENSLPNTRVLNFGVPGASMDSIARMIACLVPYFKSRCKKLEVATLWAQLDRREIFLDNYTSSWSPWKEPPFPEYILTIDDTSNRYNREKNEIMIKALCSQHDVPLYIVPWEMYEKATENGEHPTPQHHQQMLMSILEQIK